MTFLTEQVLASLLLHTFHPPHQGRPCWVGYSLTSTNVATFMCMEVGIGPQENTQNLASDLVGGAASRMPG